MLNILRVQDELKGFVSYGKVVTNKNGNNAKIVGLEKVINNLMASIVCARLLSAKALGHVIKHFFALLDNQKIPLAKFAYLQLKDSGIIVSCSLVYKVVRGNMFCIGAGLLVCGFEKLVTTYYKIISLIISSITLTNNYFKPSYASFGVNKAGLSFIK